MADEDSQHDIPGHPGRVLVVTGQFGVVGAGEPRQIDLFLAPDLALNDIHVLVARHGLVDGPGVAPVV